MRTSCKMGYFFSPWVNGIYLVQSLMCFLPPPIVVKQFAILPFKGITDGDHASVQHLIQNGSRLRFRFRAISCKMGYFFSPWVNGIYLVQSLMCFFPPPIVVKQFAILPFKGITVSPMVIMQVCNISCTMARGSGLGSGTVTEFQKFEREGNA
ncbi:hypothetical protein RHGRI_004914 [Rhododendron griersonianum]|uniref:Uncharacterized protein n=1 Tax=Rhododendron griersonianum TaxID=479676 RepID=A0AAV6LAD3_9ERIC|nr:hypothetical protein RHGRI_004914 [Rhododendron griersonianum]